MTFYSIIYGMLFLGSTSALFTLLSQNKFEEFTIAVILCLLIYCDTIYTSDYMERDNNHSNYKKGMKFIDLICFLIMSLLITIICPECTFLVGLDTNNMSGLFKCIYGYKLTAIYILLFFYCSLAIRWNEIAMDQGFFYQLSIIFTKNIATQSDTDFDAIKSFINKSYYHILCGLFLIYALLGWVGSYHYTLATIPILVILFSVLYDLVTPQRVE